MNYVNLETNSKLNRKPNLPPSMHKLLQLALLPIGSAMYVWGGGWNKEDTGAGPGARTIGLHPQWKLFAEQQDETYNHTKHRYEIMNGLDCTGYIGWVVYNLFESESDRTGYVYWSTDMAKNYSKLGWGSLIDNPDEFLVGDLISMKGHVWISLGMCEDGSVLLAHASPPGVSVCGTKGRAVELAESYMTKYHPVWQGAYPNRMVKDSYVEGVQLMRWSAGVLPDAKQYQKLSAEMLMENLDVFLCKVSV